MTKVRAIKELEFCRSVASGRRISTLNGFHSTPSKLRRTTSGTVSAAPGMTGEMLTDGIGRFSDPAHAFWHVANLLCQSKAYSEVPSKRMLLLQASIIRGDYFCLMREKNVRAVVTWRNVVAERFLRTQPHYQGTDTDANDAVVLQSFAATDRLSAIKLWSHIEKTFAHKDLFWDRHKGKLGHRPRQSSDSENGRKDAAAGMPSR